MLEKNKIPSQQNRATSRRFTGLPGTTMVFFLLAFIIPSEAQVGLDLKNSVRKIHLQKIFVKGNRTVADDRVLSMINLREGDEYLPQIMKSRVRESIQDLHKMGLFSDISVDVEYPDTLEGVYLTYKLSELPILARTELRGNKELDEDALRDVMELLEGQPFSPAALERERQNILDLYQEEGFLLTEITISQKEESESAMIIATFKIKEGKKVKVRNIRFTGNHRVKEGKLRKSMATKKKSWFFGVGGEFKDEEFRTSLDSLVLYYREHGFLDASVLSHDIGYSKSNRFLDINIKVSEGPQYLMGQVKFIHNDIVSDKALESCVLVDSGETVNIKKLDATKFQIEMLFRDIGHLFVQVQEQKTYRDSILNMTYTILEGGIAHINKVHVRGNTKTKDKVIRREIKVFPGDIFSQSLVMRSQREIMQLNFFDGVMPNFEPIGNDDVDLVFEVTEKEAGTGTFSAGAAYSARDEFVFTLGLQIPNLMGNAQRLDLNVEYGKLKKLYSIGFTEPWFMDTPTLVGGSLFWQKSHNYNYRPDDPTYGFEEYIRYGFWARLGRRLTWPDDYFSIYSRYNLTQNDYGYPRDPDDLLQQSGLESSVSFTLIRDDKDLPTFPTDGSRYTLYYKKYGGYVLGGDFNYGKYEANVKWWFPTVGKLVLGIESELGVISGEKLQQYDLYQMGGTLGFNGKMRGYLPGYIGLSRVGRSFFSFITELSYPIAPNIFYLIGFFDMGNVYGNTLKRANLSKDDVGNPLREIDLSNLLKDYGVGFRLQIPMMGIIGFDFGWHIGSQDRNGEHVAQKGMQPNFTIEAPF
ncbi:outer membrane protein assembly factor BamA [Fibrobacterota bacterium]